MNGFETGTQFEFSYAPGVTEEQILGFEIAGQIWSQYLADNATVNIYVEMTNQLPENVIGGALPGMKKDLNIRTVHNQMIKDVTSANDLTALNKLSTKGNEFAIMTNGEEVSKTKSLKLTYANAKALNIITTDREDLDGYILMSDLSGQSNVQWDYDPLLKNVDDNNIDFVSVALHEIGHVLGFVSGVDDEGWLNIVTEANNSSKEIKDDSMKFLTPLDLFRYSSQSAARGKIDLSAGGDAYFSIDGGATNLANFSTGEYQDLGGDGYQASHWKQGGDNPIGIMDPVLKMGQSRNISSLDTTAMDVMGWDVVNPGQIDWQEIYSDAVGNADDAIVEDRTKDVEKMVKKSETYHGRRSRRGGSWQVGLWQNIKFQTLDVEVKSVPENNATKFAIDNYSVDLNSYFLSNNELVLNGSEERVNVQLEVEDVVAQQIEVDESDSETVAFESSTLDLEELGRLASAKFEDVFNLGNK